STALAGAAGSADCAAASTRGDPSGEEIFGARRLHAANRIKQSSALMHVEAFHEPPKSSGQIRVAYATWNCPNGFIVTMRGRKIKEADQEKSEPGMGREASAPRGRDRGG